MPSVMKISLTLLATATTVLGAPAEPAGIARSASPTGVANAAREAVAAPAPTEYAYLTLPELYKRACHESVVMAPQGWFTTTICDNAPQCSVCVGCNAPVTKCS